MVREKIRQTPSTVWNEGPLTSLNVSALDSPNLTFQFCYDTYVAPQDNDYAIQGFIATDPQTVQLVYWESVSSKWSPSTQFTANGHTGMGCYTWGPTSVQYVMFVDLESNVRVMWIDLDTSTKPTSTHPIAAWTNSSISIPGVLPITNLAYNDILLMQMPDGTLAGANFTFDAENTQLLSNESFHMDQKPLLGSHLWLTALPNEVGELAMFCQMNGTDVTQLFRDMLTGQVQTQALSVPKT
jgi:hypothetical protein